MAFCILFGYSIYWYASIGNKTDFKKLYHGMSTLSRQMIKDANTLFDNLEKNAL